MFVGHESRITSYPPFRSPVHPEEARVGSKDNTPLYNSVDFVYRPEFRQLVLLDRDPSTGEQVSQIPSEYTLRLYAAVNELRGAPEKGSADLDISA